MRSRIAEIRRFVREYGVSQSYLAEVVFGGEIGRSYVSKLLNGRLAELRQDTLQKMIEVLEKWIDGEQEAIHIVYAKVRREIEGAPAIHQRIALDRLRSEL